MEVNVALTGTWKYQLEGQGHGSKRCTNRNMEVSIGGTLTGTWKYQLEGQGHGSKRCTNRNMEVSIGGTRAWK